jgi:hypothetical protein
MEGLREIELLIQLGTSMSADFGHFEAFFAAFRSIFTPPGAQQLASLLTC